jgi:outer membrane protein TolC
MPTASLRPKGRLHIFAAAALSCLLPAARAEPPAPRPPAYLPAVAPAADLRPLPINLPTALQLAQVRGLDIAAASARLRVALADLQQSQALWLPSVSFGMDYSRHDGRIQDALGNVFDTSKGSLMLGAGSGVGSSAVVSVTDALFSPLAARQVARAREAEVQAAANDTLMSVTEAYFTVQQARGELVGAREATRQARELVRRTEQLAPGVVPPAEATRAQAELARREQAELLARERWRVASAELLRVLHLDPTVQVEPVEPPQLRIGLINLGLPLDELITIALTSRPELAANQALVQAALARLRQERLRPLLPTS